MWKLGAGEKLSLQQHSGRLEALDLLREVGPKLAADDLFDVVLAATGSQVEAEAAFNRRRRDELRSGRSVSGG